MSASEIEVETLTLSPKISKMVKSIKDVVRNHSDFDIYRALKECNMNPDEAVQKLLNEGPFHEVKRRKDRRKENTTFKGSLGPRKVVEQSKIFKGTEPRKSVEWHTTFESDWNARRTVQGAKPHSSQTFSASTSSNTLVALYYSSSVPVHVPSNSRSSDTVGAIKREVGVLGIRHQPSKNLIKHSTIPSSSISASLAPKDISSTLESLHLSSSATKSDKFPQTIVPESVVFGTNNGKTFSSLQCDGKPPQQQNGHHEGTPPSSTPTDTSADPQKEADHPHEKLSRVGVSENEHVFIPEHFRVPEADRSRLTFGSFGLDLDSSKRFSSGFQGVGDQHEFVYARAALAFGENVNYDLPNGQVATSESSSPPSTANSGSASLVSIVVSEDASPDKKEILTSGNSEGYADTGRVENNILTCTSAESRRHQDTPLPNFTVHAHGTVNCFIILSDGVLIGVDSRSTKKIKEHKREQDEHELIADDKLKLKELFSTDSRNNKIIITASGSASRNDELWDLVDEWIQRGITSLEGIKKEIVDWLDKCAGKRKVDGKPKSKHIGLLLAGYCDKWQCYIVHRLEDAIIKKGKVKHEKVRMIYSRPGDFGAIGSGKNSANKVLSRFQEKWPSLVNTPVKALEMAKVHIKEALVAADIYDPKVGGILRVCWMEKKYTTTTLHSTFSLLHEFRMLREKQWILFFTDHSYDQVNAYRLKKQLKDWYPRGSNALPICLGMIRKWQIFLNKFESPAMSQVFLEKYRICDVDNTTMFLKSCVGDQPVDRLEIRTYTDKMMVKWYVTQLNRSFLEKMEQYKNVG